MTGRIGAVNVLSLAALSAALLWLLYASGLVDVWIESEEYGHGPLVLLVLAYLVYTRRHLFPLRTPSGAVAIFAAAPLIVFLLGALIGSPQLEMYAVWLFAVAMAASLGGIPLLKQLAVPLSIAFMVIPLPYGVETSLTAQLQLLSSQMGVWFIRLSGGVVHLEGNVIDMGGIKLLVAEACAGLRYLYPLMSLGALAGYLLRAPLWMRWTLFLATIPITVLMNSLRIGATGILVDRWGLGHTEGFLHFFEGWIVFIVALLALLLLAHLLLRLQPGAPKILDAFPLEIPQGTASIDSSTQLSVGALLALTFATLLAISAGAFLEKREELLPEHRPLAEFPVRLGDWNANEYRLPSIVESVAGASEYHYADYSSVTGRLNLYVSYYHTQRNGQIPHSPKVCIPGDGWTIESHQPLTLKRPTGGSIQANRLLIKKGDQAMVAYYWLKQGSKTYRNESIAKLDLIRSSLLENRTDGALIRLVAEVRSGEPIAEADRKLSNFAATLTDVLPLFVPD